MKNSTYHFSIGKETDSKIPPFANLFSGVERRQIPFNPSFRFKSYNKIAFFRMFWTYISNQATLLIIERLFNSPYLSKDGNLACGLRDIKAYWLCHYNALMIPLCTFSGFLFMNMKEACCIALSRIWIYNVLDVIILDLLNNGIKKKIRQK